MIAMEGPEEMEVADAIRAIAAYDSWPDYAAAVKAIRRGGRDVQDRNAYLPDPNDILERCEMVRFLKRDCDFDDYFVASVMIWGCPSYTRVRQLVERYGPSEAYRRCVPFLTNGSDE